MQACVITVIPKNCELKSGKDKVEIAIDGANLGQTFLNYITPKASYKGQTVKFAVTIVGAEGAVFYARGDKVPCKFLILAGKEGRI